MEIMRFNILPDDEYCKREIFKQSILNCQLCGSDLEFTYETTAPHEIHEEARCPSCCISMKKQSHGVH